MFGMGIGEILVILVIALLLIGPKKLPEVARSLGKALGEFKKAADDIKNGFQEDYSKASQTDENDSPKLDGQPKRPSISSSKPSGQSEEKKNPTTNRD